jgi:hypothetical protein
MEQIRHGYAESPLIELVLTLNKVHLKRNIMPILLRTNLISVHLTAVAPQELAGNFAQFLCKVIQDAKDNGVFCPVVFDVKVDSDKETSCVK